MIIPGKAYPTPAAVDKKLIPLKLQNFKPTTRIRDKSTIIKDVTIAIKKEFIERFSKLLKFSKSR